VKSTHPKKNGHRFLIAERSVKPGMSAFTFSLGAPRKPIKSLPMKSIGSSQCS